MPLPAVLNAQTFFKFWVCKAFSKENKILSRKDLRIAQIAAIVFGIGTFGIGTWICRACLFDKKILSHSQNLKFLQAKIDKVFSMTNQKKKSQLLQSIGRLECSNPHKSKHVQRFFDEAEERYHLIKAIDFRQFKRFNEDFCFYAITRKFCDQLNAENIDSELANEKEEILSYLSYKWDSGKYFNILLKYCDFKKITRFMLSENSKLKNEFITFLSKFEFAKFRENFHCIKHIDWTAPVGNIEEFNKIKTLYFACEILEVLDSDSDERDFKMQTIKDSDSIQTVKDSFLWELLGSHCKVEHISFLISYRFGFQLEKEIIRDHFLEKIILTKDKREASLPLMWANINKLRLNISRLPYFIDVESFLTEIIKTLTTKEKFQYVIQSLCYNPCDDRYDRIKFLRQCMEFTHLTIPLLPVHQRIEIIKNILWSKCVDWAKSDSQEAWDDYFPYCSILLTNQGTYFDKIHHNLRQLIKWLQEYNQPISSFEVDTHHLFPFEVNQSILDLGSTSDTISYLLTSKAHYQQLGPFFCEDAKKKILILIEEIAHIHGKRPLILDIEPFTEFILNLKAGPGAWLMLKNLLELTVFKAMMNNEQPIKLLEEPCQAQF